MSLNTIDWRDLFSGEMVTGWLSVETHNDNSTKLVDSNEMQKIMESIGMMCWDIQNPWTMHSSKVYSENNSNVWILFPDAQKH